LSAADPLGAARAAGRISVSAICTFHQPLAGDLAFWALHGIRKVGASVAKLEAHGWDDGVARLAASGVEVGNLIGLGPFALDQPRRWPGQGARLGRVIGAAVALRAGCVVVTTGPAGALTWEDAAAAFEEAIGPTLAEARAAGVRFALEHTHALRADVGFVHTLRDSVDLARRLGVGVCMELNACWAERALEATIRDAVADGTLALVQVSDYRIGTTSTPDRLVPGDGDIPLSRILGWILDAGYTGDFDLELIGPRIEEEGYDTAVPRAVARLTALLADRAAP
jgi:sugar phosphate isomerase/epimerase